MPFERFGANPRGSYSGFTGINDGKGCLLRFLLLIVIVGGLIILARYGYLNFAS